MTGRLLQEECVACSGVGVSSKLRPCVPCDGIGWVWLDGGPLFGAKPTSTLAKRIPGELVRVGPGGSVTVRISAHVSREDPHTTYVRVVDDWDDTESDPMPVRSTLGVHAVIAARTEEREGKHTDMTDPMLQERGELL